jgi:hypothetical protein
MPEPATWYFSPGASLFFVYVVPLLTAGTFAVRFFVRAMIAARHARNARRAADAESQTLDEGDTILRGVAEIDDEAGGVRVTIEQEGSEAESSGSWTVKWMEMHRRMLVAPFTVVHASGARVRVEPGKKTFLAAPLVATERVSEKRRRRVAEIVSGADVWITGVLGKEVDPRGEGGYRGSRVWMMRPANDGEMIVSTDAPEATFAKRATRARVLGVLFTLLLGVMLVSHLDYHGLVLGGSRTTATIVDKRIHSGDDSDTYDLVFTASRGKTTVEDTMAISPATYNAWNAGQTFPAFASFGEFPSIEPGDGARALGAPTLLTLVAWVGLAIFSLAYRPREWHEGARVDESHAGRLAD